MMLFHNAVTGWSPTGDIFYVASSVEHAMAGHPFTDFETKGLPAYYPSLYFWMVALIGWVLHLGVFRAVRTGVALALLVVPFLVYGLVGKVAGRAFAVACGGLCVLFVAYGDLFAKPHEWLAGVCAVAWAIQATRSADRADEDGWWPVALWGVVLGLATLSYELWTLLVALVPLFLQFMDRSRPVSSRWRGARAVIASWIVGAIVCSPWWLPYGLAILKHGSQDLQPLWFITPYANLGGYATPFDWQSLAGKAAILALLGGMFLIRRRYVQAIYGCFLGAFMFQGVLFLDLALGGHGFVGVKWNMLGNIAAAFMLAALAAEGYGWLKQKWPDRANAGAVAGLCMAGLLMLPGLTSDTVVLQHQYTTAFNPPSYPAALVKALNATPDPSGLNLLMGYAGGVLQQSPVYAWMPYNAFYADPAELVLDRLSALQQEVKTAAGASAFADWMRHNKFAPINGVVATRVKGGYEVQTILVPSFPNGGNWINVIAPTKDLAAPAFRVTWQGDGVTVFLVANQSARTT